MAGSAGADLLTVVRRSLGWYHAAKTQQVADGAGRSSSSTVAFCGLTNRVRLPLAREFLVRYVGDNPACSSPVVSVAAPVSGYPGRSRALGLPSLGLFSSLPAGVLMCWMPYVMSVYVGAAAEMRANRRESHLRA